MADRRKRRPRERPFKERESYTRDSYGSGRQEIRRSTRDYLPGESHDKSGSGIQAAPKQPVILAKPDSIDSQKQRPPTTLSPNSESGKFNPKGRSQIHSSEISSPSRSSQSPEMFPSRMSSHSLGEAEQKSAKSDPHKGIYGSLSSTKQNSNPSNSSQDEQFLGSIKDKGNANRSFKMFDSFLNWMDTGIEILEDQTDFLVVGVLGMQGVGKSTIMSYLAGDDVKSKTKKWIFPSQTQDVMERASNMTNGVDMHVTEERIILLDAQPILSASLLEQCIYNDRKMSAEYNGPSVGIEMQSLQIATFFLSVCHVVILVQDWFTDISLYRFLQSAEMLKLSTPAPSADSTNSENEFNEFYPHLVFLQNKADDVLFDPSYVIAMMETTSNMMKYSKLLYKGSISLSKSALFPNLTACIPRSSEINLFLIPKFSTEESVDFNGSSDDEHFHRLPQYIPHPDEKKVLETFRNMIFSIRRLQLARHTLTEKNWFYYAAKTWDAIKKSPLMSEFHRLLV